MQSLQRFEQFVERMMEGSFARLFRSPIQPAEIAKRLEREMEAHPTISVGRTYVPNHYEITLHPDEFAQFEPFKHLLEHNMAEFISDLAAERGYSLVSRPKVLLQPGDDVPKRSIDVVAQLTDQPASSTLAGVAGAPTMRTNRSHGSVGGVAEASEAAMPRTQAMTVRPQPHQPAPSIRSNAPPPDASLQPLDGDMAGRNFAITKTLLTVGRGLDNDLVIDDARVSRHHAQVVYRHGHHLLRDLRSTNGTFVNNQPVEAVVLAPGDMISFGGFEILFKQE
ncbi:MAG: hypothetical protein QOH93_624 [Chloroflexia bacterium]|nr:hypothetical protein [Chloroflexia bacterium]